MNLDEAREEVKDRGFDYLTPSRLTTMLNTAKDGFEDWWHWPWLAGAASGPTPLLIPGLKLVTYVASGGRELLGLTLQQATQEGTDLAERGTPGYWYLVGPDTLHVWPGDGADVAVTTLVETPPLVNDDDTPLIPARYHSLWIDLAVCEAYKDADNFPAAQALRGDVAMRMQDVIGRYETVNRQHSPFMASRHFSEDD